MTAKAHPRQTAQERLSDLPLLSATFGTLHFHLDRYCNRGYSCNRDHYRDPDQKEKMPQLQDQMQKER